MFYELSDRPWSETLKPDPYTAALSDRRWTEYGLADLKLGEVNPNLFGYDMK